ncbi:hypothetical protein, partial [Sporofaciens musculi]|uniref:hypothetical protein n=1 Tax=Sporofaciens musculi TaxID=2681861 RepID=UPI0025A17646
MGETAASFYTQGHTAIHALRAGGLRPLIRNFLSLGITLLFHIHKGIIGCRQALDFLAFRY